MADDSLSSLVVRVASGDAIAFRHIYDLHARRLYAVALRITNQDALARDATHDALLQLWRNGHRFDAARGSADAWLLSLVRYRALDIARCRLHEVPGHDLPEPVDDSPDQIACLSAKSNAAALHVCLGRLKVSQRQLVQLVFLEGLSYAEVAERTKIPVTTVKSSVRRSLRALRRTWLEQLGQKVISPVSKSSLG